MICYWCAQGECELCMDEDEITGEPCRCLHDDSDDDADGGEEAGNG